LILLHDYYYYYQFNFLKKIFKIIIEMIFFLIQVNFYVLSTT